MAPAQGVPIQDLATESVDKINVPVRGIQDHALIGNLRTAALVSIDGSIESMCIPYFDSPSVFARILDADKGGHFSITPTWNFKPKQAYAPNSNVLVTKFLSEDGVGVITDLLVPKGANTYRKGEKTHLPWLIRKVESITGTVPFRMECAPAFNYCRDKHTTEVRFYPPNIRLLCKADSIACKGRLGRQWRGPREQSPIHLARPKSRPSIPIQLVRQLGVPTNDQA